MAEPTEVDNEIRLLCYQLFQLLDNPEYGLFTWIEARQLVGKKLLDKLQDALDSTIKES